MVIDATYALRWQPNTGYTAGRAVLLPDGTAGTAKANFSSGASFDASNWTVVSGSGGSTPDATDTTAGKVRLAGDLGGSAATRRCSAPSRPGVRISRQFVGSGAPPPTIAGAAVGDTHRDADSGTVYDITGV